MKIGNIHFIQHSSLPGFWTAKSLSSLDVIEERARAINALQLADGFTAVCGRREDDEYYLLYLVPHISPVEVARCFEVGSCAGISAFNDMAEALAIIDAVDRKAKIAPFFADTHGFKFVFTAGLDYPLIPFLEEVVTVGIESMLDENGKIGSTILNRGFVHLWWD